jgi:hypothetical protein
MARATRERKLYTKTLRVDGVTFPGTGVALSSGATIDLNGEADAFIIDADGDTTISSPTDDQIDFEIAGADDFRMTANTFTALSGSVIVGEHRHASQTLTATGAITINSGLVLLSHATVVIAATLDAPTVGDELYIVNSSASGDAAHTVTLPEGVTWDGTNDVATLDAPGEALHVLAISATRWFILENIGSVGLS